ncbi:AAA family ATPase [Umezawaea sp. Da 62-37]|uniref:AAA family ATPase n=1 Tax=Umezawaea sp. Da 62-37 TaxID=3075927 RepID=UPI0028F72A08|nr:AAA family ATPase [Umezawaea sp. Da 62-37]WNV87417.1 AAA family ATPase [Umezawaea sp. Da 62-37]
MVRLIHLNGPPGIGKSTLAALYVDRHPGTLHLDVDGLHRLVGGWEDEETDTWPVVWSLVQAMAAAHLGGGRDVVLPHFFGRIEEITSFEEFVRSHGADYREVVLLDDREAAVRRFDDRARDSVDPWIRHHHRLIGLSSGSVVLETMYDSLVEVMRLRPGAVVVPSAVGQVQETYGLLAAALGETVP